MKVSPNAGKMAQASMLVNVPGLVTAYYSEIPEPSVPEQRVVFGTSGHRGSAFKNSFNEWHVLAISQAICLYREQKKIDGPLFLGIDTHALSIPAFASALEVLAANGVEVLIAQGVDPFGGAGVHYWNPIAERYGLNLTVVNEAVDPTFSFMTVDWDGQILMDPSSPYAMQRLIGMKDRFDLSFACDTDHDDPGEIYQELTREFGEPAYDRVEAPATPEQKKLLAKLSPSRLRTENIYKIYAESFRGSDHLHQILEEAQTIVNNALAVAH
jgi:phosphoglucomutase